MIRAGVVGFGLSGRVFHAPMIAAVDGLELAAVVERHSHNAAAQYPGITTYTSYEAMLADDSLDFVVLGTPSTVHFEMAMQAIAAGKNVVVDKPTCVTSAQVAELGTAAKAAGKQAFPYHNRRWDGDFLTLQKLLSEQKLGRLVSFESTFDRWRPIRRDDNWRENGLPGGGILLDLGTHLVDQALVLFGLPEAVRADVRGERDGAVTPDYFNIQLQYGGMTATVGGTCLTCLPRPHFIVRGTRGNYARWGLDSQEGRLRQLPQIVEPGWGAEPAANWGTLCVDVDGGMVSHPVPAIPGDYRQFYIGVREALLGNAPAPVLPIDAWRVARILEWATQSSEERREIPCDWSDAPAI